MIVQADDVARIGFPRLHAVGGHEGQCVGHTHFFVEAHVVQAHAALILAGAQAHEGNAIAVARIHIRLNLEDEPRERLLQGIHRALGSCARERTGGALGKGRKQLRDPKVIDGRPKEHGRLPGGTIGLDVPGLRCALHKLDLREKLTGRVAQDLARRLACEAVDPAVLAHAAALARGIGIDAILEQVIDALQLASHADGPGDRGGCDLEHPLDLVQQLDRRAPVAIELIDEGHNRRVAHAAHLHQFDGALLDALRAVDDHEGGVDRRQGAVGVLREVLMSGGIEKIDNAAFVGKLHDRRGDRDTALLFEAHPVGGRVARGLASLHRARHLNGAAEQQEFFGERRLAGVGVRDDRKSPSPTDFGRKIAHECGSVVAGAAAAQRELEDGCILTAVRRLVVAAPRTDVLELK